MTAGPLENKRGEPSLVEKKIHDEQKQLRLHAPADRRRLSANKFAIAFDTSRRQSLLCSISTSTRLKWTQANTAQPTRVQSGPPST
ncbi:unnamed protein product, partial [Iphiclides podalirius]